MKSKLLEKLYKINEKYINYAKLNGSGVHKKIIKLLTLKFRYLYYFAARRGLVKSSIVVKTFANNSFLTNIADGNNAVLYFYGILGSEETGVTAFIIKSLEANSVFYDVGSSYGFYSVLATNLISNGEIHSFEPSNKIFDFLSKNTQMQKTNLCHVNNSAVGEVSGKIEYYDNSAGGHSLLGTTVKDLAVFDTEIESRVSKYVVDSISLDDYIINNPIPTLIKIDVEGGELNVIRGSEKLLTEHGPEIVLEVRTDEKAISSSFECFEKLYSYGYLSYELSDSGELNHIPQEEYRSNLIETKSEKGFCNFVFAKK